MIVQSDNIQLTITKPVLKWAGGKSQLLNELNSRLPKSYNKYIEPFIGGGALFFNLKPDQAIIADLNPELVNLYKSIASSPEDVLNFLETFKNDHDFFYEIR